ncbi:hypothetical protein M073_2722 [Bacteroides fragilis str. DS-71]|nr:hypothetical protein M117_2849 [Bacteroides fragilis str. 3774 T13]EXZ09320.1 hypothetical protein M073_2722 [Bacteroides fragilis str. DS-71]EYA79335.1 hypothetical protein M134_3073 [Bacteroides fragilis str. S24L34]
MSMTVYFYSIFSISPYFPPRITSLHPAERKTNGYGMG